MLGFSCSSNGQNSEFENMDVNQFAKYIANDNVQTLDVRTPDEFSEGHIKDAININVFDDDFLDEATKELDKSRPVAVYCRSGKRSVD
ncbi:MAG: rhodanese-like domain-containing protein, partial [Muribaculaceae bacterium]|nr:rhodanese-like domain-containing protein [Muribaculaceae bacterium]